jgi:outer membrane protein OmpA-like peptidoglycan-associated protein
MVLAAIVALAGQGLAAQHAGQWEVGAFSSYTHYDPAFGLPQRAGGGIRLGYLVGDVVGVEGELLFQPEYTVMPISGTPVIMQPLIASASLVLNAVHLPRLMVYALGGYTLLDFGTRAPYGFTDNAAHGGAGVRLFLSERIALRLEGRAIYTVSTKSTFGPTTPKHYVATLGLSVFHLGAAPKEKSLCPTPPRGATLDAKGCPIDSDGDGVPDGIDQCPNTPLGAKVDAKGCPIDSDGDGVPDGIDQCPDTPKGAVVDAKGCPIDSDGDGVPDGIDQCPNTPKGAVVDAKGCPIDSDGDGVPDGIDQCPNTPPGTKVDAVGCPLPIEAVKPLPPPPAPVAAPVAAPAAPPKCPPPPPGSQVDANGCLVLFTPEAARPAAPGAPPRPTLILTGVTFETARSALTRDSYVVLDAVAASLLANPEIRIEIAGYTDSTGIKFGNLRLSQSRAAAVRFYLARKGVPPTRMVSKGYGASGYVAPNSTAAGRAQNRRVELHKLP